jgi:hypothetical protein
MPLSKAARARAIEQSFLWLYQSIPRDEFKEEHSIFRLIGLGEAHAEGNAALVTLGILIVLAMGMVVYTTA